MWYVFSFVSLEGIWASAGKERIFVGGRGEKDDDDEGRKEEPG